MATIEGYGGRFIGNDFVRPQVKRPVMNDMVVPRPVAKVHVQQYAQRPKYTQQPAHQVAAVNEVHEQPAVADFSTQLEPAVAPATRPRRFTNFMTKRNGVIAAAVVVLIVGSVVAVPHLSAALHTTRTVANRIALGASVDMHHAKPVSFTMPQNSILVKNGQVSTFVDAIEGQQININVGNAAVTPKPLDLQKWFMTMAGPQSNSTIIEANSANISAYLSTVAQQHGASSADISGATTQLAQALLKYNGATITLTN